MPATPSTAASRPQNSALVTSASLIPERILRRARCSGLIKRNGSWTSFGSAATWKIWGNSLGALDLRADPQNLPDGLIKQKWPADTFAQIGSGDFGSAYHERGEIYDLVRDSKITGFAIVSGDRHSFWAGYAAALLPPAQFEPVGISFVGASLASPGTMEAFEHRLPKDHPLRSLFLADRPAGKPAWTYNMMLKHGVRSCLEYARSFDL